MEAKKSHDAACLLASAARTAAGTVNEAAIRLPRPLAALCLILDVTAAATDVGDTLDVKVQTKLDGTNWLDVAAFTKVLGNGGAKRHVAKIACGAAEAMFADTVLAAGSVRNLLGDEWRVVHAIVDSGDANQSFTFAVTAIPM